MCAMQMLFQPSSMPTSTHRLQWIFLFTITKKMSHTLKTYRSWFGLFPLWCTRAQTTPASCSLFPPVASGSVLQPDLIGSAFPPPCGCWQWSSCCPKSRRGRWLRVADAGWSATPPRYWCSDCPPGCKQTQMERRFHSLSNSQLWSFEEPMEWLGLPVEMKGKTPYTWFKPVVITG